MVRKSKENKSYNLLNEIIDDFEGGEHKSDEAKRKTLEDFQLRRKRLFPIVESHWEKECRMIAYVTRFEFEGSDISEKDIIAFESMLGSIGTVNNLILLINSPGGSAETAEKILDMCRRHCSGTFRVVVPNKAKSAATLVALGSDSIIMGDCSELGPIDPQSIITVGNVPHHLSVLSFIQARDELIKKIVDCKKNVKDATPYLAQFHTSTMEPAWIRECERQVAFSNDFAIKWLSQHMLKNMYPECTTAQLKLKARSIALNFTSIQARWSHGRMIGPEECSKIGINVEYLKPDDPIWKAIFEIYTRCDRTLGEYKNSKIIITSDSLLIA